jgi:hypothetical protein
MSTDPSLSPLTRVGGLTKPNSIGNCPVLRALPKNTALKILGSSISYPRVNYTVINYTVINYNVINLFFILSDPFSSFPTQNRLPQKLGWKRGSAALLPEFSERSNEETQHMIAPVEYGISNTRF